MKESQDTPRHRELNIDLSRSQRLRSWIGYVALIVLIAAVFVFLFNRFTGSFWLAIGLVTFMLGYMILMGWLASRKIEHRD